MHSSRMRTTRLLPVFPNMHCAGEGVSALGGVFSWGGLLVGGVCSQGGLLPEGSASGGGVFQHALRQTLPCEQNDWQTGVKT